MVNVIGNLPIFASYTLDKSKKERQEIFLVAVVTGAGIVIGFALVGDILLRQVFLVSTTAFKIAAGLLVFAVAAKGVILGSSHVHDPAMGGNNIAVFPLGFPYLAGPGTILTTIMLIQTDGRMLTIITAILVYISIFPILRLSTKVSNLSKDFARINLDIGIAYNSDIEHVIDVVNRVGSELANDPLWKEHITKKPEFLRVSKLADSSVVIKILGETLPLKQWEVTGELRKRILVAFSKERIEIPFRQLDVKLKNTH